MLIQWEMSAWEQYVSWQSEDKRTLKRINELIKSILRNPFSGVGKPEPLKGDLGGWWSRRIDEENRIVYKQKGDTIIILSVKDHY